jgi:hypothetical protein
MKRGSSCASTMSAMATGNPHNASWQVQPLGCRIFAGMRFCNHRYAMPIELLAGVSQSNLSFR